MRERDIRSRYGCSVAYRHWPGTQNALDVMAFSSVCRQ